MWTLDAPAELVREIKKSRFVVRAGPVEQRADARAFIERSRDPQATHNCWAWKIGQDYRFSDDGEPGGTAGQPILRAIEGQGLDRVVVLVTRYFGGIKLGAGGLVRAYGGAAAECLRQAPRREVRPTVAVRIEAPGALYPLFAMPGVQKQAERFEAAGLVVELAVEQDRLAELERSVRDATRGRGRIERH
jgi:uncharacterized YigZ family protein